MATAEINPNETSNIIINIYKMKNRGNKARPVKIEEKKRAD